MKIYNRALSSEEIRVEYARAPVAVQAQTVNLANRTSSSLSFTWNTTNFAKGNYTVSVMASSVGGELDTADNTLLDGWIFVAMPGDINADGIVDIFDIATVALAFGSTPSEPNWNPIADINNDLIADIFDIVVVAMHFGETS